MPKNYLDKLIEAVIYCDQHGLMQDKAGRAARRIFGLGISDSFVAGMFLQRARKHHITQALSGSPFLLPRLKQGDIFRGFDLRGKPILHPLGFLIEHSFCLGGTGSGKTTQAIFLALQVAARIKGGLWLFDLRKREWRKLRPVLARLGIELIIVPARKLRLNPTQLPSKHVPVTEWASRLAEMFVYVLHLPPRATKLLHVTILKLYHKFVQEPPTVFDIREAVAADKQANPQARQAIVDALDPLLMSIGDVLRWRLGWKSEDLARKHIVFELQGVSDVDRDFLLNSLILPLFTSRVAQGLSNVPMNLFISCDEAQRLATSKGGALSDLLGLIRGSGIGLDLSCQTGSDLVPQLFSNTGNKSIGRVTSATDIEAIGSAMGLTREQKQWVMTNLNRPGLFVGQVSQGWRHPFVYCVPPFHLPSIEDETDSDVHELNRLPVVPV